MPSNLTWAILKTVSYSEVFNQPLTLAEIHKFLISIRANQQSITKVIKNIKVLKEKSGFYFFKGKEKTVDVRHKKEAISLEKLSYGKKFAKLLFFIPSIKVIAVTGSLALLSSDKNDDIDFLIITSIQRIWTTRFFCVFFLKLLGVYRKPNINTDPDKICINMYLQENHLSLPNSERDLYSAHEIVQAVELYSRPGYENILLNSNPWVKKFLPNATRVIARKSASWRMTKQSHWDKKNIFSSLFDLLENLLKSFQLYYMRNKRTTEVIRDGYLRFHPRDARKFILENYKQNLDKYIKIYDTS